MRLLPLLLLLTIAATTTTTNAFNITKILAGHPQFSTFNHYLTETHLAFDINRRLTITVLAVDNAGMSSLLDRHLSLPTLKNVLALHCLVDYYGAKKLHQLTGGSALASSFFQATGAAPGTTGFVNITDHRAGHVSFRAEDAEDSASPSAFVKSIKELPYNLSIVQISSALSSPEAEAPAAAPAPVNLTAAMAKTGCRLFSSLLLSAPDALAAYQSNTESGLTAFCPVDSAVLSFAPKFNNLTKDQQLSLLLYHAEPVYNSLQQLKTGNGLSTTLATDGTRKKRKDFTFTVQDDGDSVTLETKVVTAKILKTVVDQEPVAVYSVNKFLQPKELFKPADAPAPAPAGPKKKSKSKKKKDASAAASPDDSAYSPDDAPADQKAADDNAAGARLPAFLLLAFAATLAVAV